jgi:hypothetical protein
VPGETLSHFFEDGRMAQFAVLGTKTTCRWSSLRAFAMLLEGIDA